MSGVEPLDRGQVEVVSRATEGNRRFDWVGRLAETDPVLHGALFVDGVRVSIFQRDDKDCLRVELPQDDGSIRVLTRGELHEVTNAKLAMRQLGIELG